MIFDHRGVGTSEDPGGELSTELLADDTAALLDALEIERAGGAQLWCSTVLAGTKGEVRANLRAPIVVNLKNGKARQVVLVDNDLPIRYRFLPKTIESNKEVADYVGANA